MKRVSLGFLFFLISIAGYSQTKIKTFKNCLAIYNDYSEKFDLQDYNYANITFTFYETYISVDDNAHSIYRVRKINPKDYSSSYESTTFDCLDEQNRSCKVSIIKYDGGSYTIDVIYDKRAFIYVVN